jgi:hypothetical protein
MIKKRLFEILSTLDKNELKQFGRYISSVFFNTNKSVIRLFKEIRKSYPGFTGKGLDDEKLFKAVYDNRKFDDKTFRYLVTELARLAEGFLVFQLSGKSPVTEKLVLAEALQTRRLFNQSGRILKNIEKDLEKEKIFSLDLINYKNEVNLLWNDLNIALDRHIPLADKRTEHTEFTIYYSVIELAIMLNILVGLKNMYNIDADETVIRPYFENINYKAILGSLDKTEKNGNLPTGKKGTIDAFKAYLCYMITFLDTKDELYFNRLKEIVINGEGIYSREELFNLYGLLGSCCTLKRESIDDHKYLKEHFEIEKASLRAGLLTHYDEHYMQVNGYFLLFNTSIELGDLDWAETFAEEHLPLLSPEIRDPVSDYTKALLLFEKSDYISSIGKLNKVRFPIQSLKLLVRELLLKNYYELGYYEEAYSLVDSFSHFLTSSRKLNPVTRNRFLNYLDLSKKLLNLKTRSGTGFDAEKLVAMINGSKGLSSKRWLLLKAGELKK